MVKVMEKEMVMAMRRAERNPE